MSKKADYVQIAEAAELLGVCRNTLRNWGRDGKISEYRHPINDYRLYKRSELQKLQQRIERPAKKPR